jgi:hypothetical protein
LNRYVKNIIPIPITDNDIIVMQIYTIDTDKGGRIFVWSNSFKVESKTKLFIAVSNKVIETINMIPNIIKKL